MDESQAIADVPEGSARRAEAPEAPGEGGAPAERTAAEVRAELKQALEAELAVEQAGQDEQAVWELSRRERAALTDLDEVAALVEGGGPPTAEEKEQAVQRVRVEWLQEQRL